MKRIYLIASVMLSVLMASSQTVEPTDSVNSIVNRINASDVITIDQPAALQQRIVQSPTDEAQASTDAEDNKPKKKGVQPGYRVLVFADNNARTAKNRANTVARRVAGAVPGQRTYVVYESPYWRMKLGDFTTREDAEKAASIIRRKFPSYSSEVRVIRDRVVIR
ncbi:MAG: SPOR domain-containing protein [Muribaculaceae bacterium]|nr:SPOR domain-containing protein [Muribaculaceae bacterium]